MKATILRAGFQTSVQDLGRAGFRELGVSVGGALDEFALRTANLLVGNNESSAGLEIAIGGSELRFADERVVAWCGGRFDVSIGTTIIPPGHAALIHSGELLRFGFAEMGCRAWLAISGGVDVPMILRSRSTDLRTKFGGFHGRPLNDGDELPLGKNSQLSADLSDSLRITRIANWKPAHDWSSPAKEKPVLRFLPGADWNRFSGSARESFVREPFTLSPDSDRMGARFEHPILQCENEVDLASEAVTPGTVQVPPAGKLILLLGDCQTIGGYPKIAHVITVDLSIAAQLRPEDSVRFQASSLPEAHQLLVERGNSFRQFACGIESHLR